MLTKLEDQILLTVWRFKGKAYGINIYRHLEEMTGEKIAVGVVYFALDRLTKRGLLDSHKGEPTAVRGGMRKRYYKITETGMVSLNNSKQAHDRLWNGFPGSAPIES